MQNPVTTPGPSTTPPDAPTELGRITSEQVTAVLGRVLRSERDPAAVDVAAFGSSI